MQIRDIQNLCRQFGLPQGSYWVRVNIASEVLPRSLLVGLALAGFFVVSIAAGLGAVGPAAAADRTLEDGQTYWQGNVITAENATAPNESLYINASDTGQTAQTLTADNNGNITVDTATLDGTYNLTNSTGVTLFTFEIAVQILDVDYTSLQLAYGGELKEVVLDIDSNRGSFELELSSDAWDGNRTVTAHGGEEITLNASNLPDGPHTIHGQVSDTTAEFTVTVDVSNPPSFTYVFPESSPEYPNDTREFVDGRSYWQGQNVVWDSGVPGLEYQIRDTSGNLILERATNETGHGVFDTSGLVGTYDLINTSSGDTVGSITVEQQRVMLDMAAADNTLTEGDETTLSVSTNRNKSDMVVWSDKLPRDTLQTAIPDTIRVGEDVILQNVSDGDIFSIETDGIEPGTYELGLWSTDSDAQDRLTLTVEAEEEEGDSSSGGSTGSSGSSSVQSTATATATPTASPTPEPTASPTPTLSPTARPTATPTVEPIETTTDSSEIETQTETPNAPTQAPGQPGFGFALAVLTVIATLLYRLK